MDQNITAEVEITKAAIHEPAMGRGYVTSYLVVRVAAINC